MSLSLYINNIIDELEEKYDKPVYPADFIKQAMWLHDACYSVQAAADTLAKHFRWEVKHDPS